MTQGLLSFPDPATEPAYSDAERRRRILAVLREQGPLLTHQIAGKAILPPYSMIPDLRKLALQHRVQQDDDGRWRAAVSGRSPDEERTGTSALPISEPPAPREANDA